MRKFFTYISLLFLIVIIGCAALSPSISAAKDITGDDRFVANDNGVVYDRNTSLEWYAGPDKDTNWNKAKQWVERLQVAGGGWRMPTGEELKTLYEKNVGTRNMTPLLKTTGWWIWSGETKGSSSARLLAFDDNYDNWFYQGTSKNVRGFAVRSRK